jgi:hypothetical protein
VQRTSDEELAFPVDITVTSLNMKQSIGVTAIHRDVMMPPHPYYRHLTKQAALYPVTKIYGSLLLIHQLVTRGHVNRLEVEKSC